MGCDIHSIGQVFLNGKWVTKVGHVGGDNRNYDSFAVLADIRNGYGFAGVPTGEGWPVVSEPRGLPKDLEFTDKALDTVQCPPWQYRHQKNTAEWQTEMWLGDHSFSWLLLSEIEFFVEKNLINKTYEHTGVVDREHYESLKDKKEPPSEWSGGVWGPNVVTVTSEEADAGVPSTHVSMKWVTDAMDSLSTLKAYIEELRKIQKEFNVSACDVRLVFGFDS